MSDVDTNLHCIAVWGQQVADPEDGIWRPLTEESFSSLSIDAVNFGLELQSRGGGGYGGVDVHQVDGEKEVDGQGHPVNTKDSTSLVGLTSRSGSCESLASTPEVCGVRENSVDLLSHASPSGLHGRVLSASAIPSSHAQLCFHLLGETGVQLAPQVTLQQCVQVLSQCSFLLRKPAKWDIGLALCRPVSVSVFLQEYKPGRYVLQVRRVPSAQDQSPSYVAIDAQQLGDPADRTCLPLTETSFARLSITQVISDLQLVPR